jgi:hypothetical protein
MSIVHGLQRSGVWSKTSCWTRVVHLHKALPDATIVEVALLGENFSDKSNFCVNFVPDLGSVVENTYLEVIHHLNEQ